MYGIASIAGILPMAVEAMSPDAAMWSHLEDCHMDITGDITHESDMG